MHENNNLNRIKRRNLNVIFEYLFKYFKKYSYYKLLNVFISGFGYIWKYAKNQF